MSILTECKHWDSHLNNVPHCAAMPCQKLIFPGVYYQHTQVCVEALCELQWMDVGLWVPEAWRWVDSWMQRFPVATSPNSRLVTGCSSLCSEPSISAMTFLRHVQMEMFEVIYCEDRVNCEVDFSVKYKLIAILQYYSLSDLLPFSMPSWRITPSNLPHPKAVEGRLPLGPGDMGTGKESSGGWRFDTWPRQLPRQCGELALLHEL